MLESSSPTVSPKTALCPTVLTFPGPGPFFLVHVNLFFAKLSTSIIASVSKVISNREFCKDISIDHLPEQ